MPRGVYERRPRQAHRRDTMFQEDDIVTMRNLRANGTQQQLLADLFECSLTTVNQICTGKTYSLYGGPVSRRLYIGDNR